MIEVLACIILMPFAVLAIVFTGAIGYGFAKSVFSWAANWDPFKSNK